jgi:enamine deaminase RidA (YjgF/YER057c/UK114 family)
MSIDEKLQALGLELPAPVRPAYQYVAVVVHEDLAWVSGQIPRSGDQVLLTGKAGAQVTLEQARLAARACVLQGLAQVREAIGSLDRVERVIKVTGFVASAAGFVDQPKVMDAASELLVQVFGEAGRHARSAVGVAELPRGVPVEVELVLALKK